MPSAPDSASSQAPFRFRHRVDVRFKDVDVGGHAHHSHALVYFEEARQAYWREVSPTSIDEVDYILAEAEIRYHARVLWPQTLDVGVRISKLGKKHFEMSYEVLSAEGERLVSGRTVQIMYDYAKGASKPMPVEIRRRIDGLDGPFGPGGRPT